MNDNNLELTSRLKSKIRTASDGIKSTNTATYPTPAMKLPIALLVAAVAPAFVHAQVFYTTDFQGAVGSEWSDPTTSMTPNGGRRFLGELNNTAVTLNLSGLPAHTDVTLSFDLFVIRSWDGNGPVAGPDLWTLSIGDAGSQSAVLSTTFANHHSGQVQSYPVPYDGISSSPAQTGAAETQTLGYQFFDTDAFVTMDSVYRLTFTVPHSAGTFVARFDAPGLQPFVDESWGLDNVTVSVSAATPVPEPSEYAAVAGLGLVGFALWRRRAARA